MHGHVLAAQGLRRIYRTGKFNLAGEDIPCDLFLGGDLPWLKGLLGIATPYNAMSVWSRGIWTKNGGWQHKGVPRTKESDAAALALHKAGTRVMAAGGVVRKPQLVPPSRLCFVVCILHCTMAVGRLANCAFHALKLGFPTHNINIYLEKRNYRRAL